MNLFRLFSGNLFLPETFLSAAFCFPGNLRIRYSFHLLQRCVTVQGVKFGDHTIGFFFQALGQLLCSFCFQILFHFFPLRQNIVEIQLTGNLLLHNVIVRNNHGDLSVVFLG